ncbi:MAG TPA: hypothetical protein VIU13_04370 [Chryseolinea sp.]
MEVTESHLFLGYKPLIIGISLLTNSLEHQALKDQSHICLSFGKKSFDRDKTWRGFLTDRTAIARLVLRKIGEKVLHERVILFFEGEFGDHSFLRPIHQFANRQRRKLLKDSPNNVALPGNLVDQVRIAYTVPRLISIVTVSDGTLMNMFPTDLHGVSGQRGYLSSLRMGGMAGGQVEKYKQIVISEVDLSLYKASYALGKNHMANLKDENFFTLYHERSGLFDFPLPSFALKYREMKVKDSFDHGIHRIYLYEIMNEKSVQRSNTLAHIHQYYAQWRIDQGIPTELFFR